MYTIVQLTVNLRLGEIIQIARWNVEEELNSVLEVSLRQQPTEELNATEILKKSKLATSKHAQLIVNGMNGENGTHAALPVEEA